MRQQQRQPGVAGCHFGGHLGRWYCRLVLLLGCHWNADLSTKSCRPRCPLARSDWISAMHWSSTAMEASGWGDRDCVRVQRGCDGESGRGWSCPRSAGKNSKSARGWNDEGRFAGWEHAFAASRNSVVETEGAGAGAVSLAKAAAWAYRLEETGADTSNTQTASTAQETAWQLRWDRGPRSAVDCNRRSISRSG